MSDVYLSRPMGAVSRVSMPFHAAPLGAVSSVNIPFRTSPVGPLSRVWCVRGTIVKAGGRLISSQTQWGAAR